MTTDAQFMQLALDLAGRGRYTTDPNPRVGCVVVEDGAVVGRGWHDRAGQPHAEVVALAEAGRRAFGATVYVTLEPCCHQGRTPPCTQALVDAQVSEVVFALEDPNPKVAGQGLVALRAAGIDVRQGPLVDESRTLNLGFVSRMTRGRPYVRTKLAASLDGKTALASGASQWITGPESRADVHRQRAAASVILTGSGTVITDDPRLTARLGDADTAVLQPQVVIVDSELKVSTDAKLFSLGSPLLFTRCEDRQLRQQIEQAGGEIEVQVGGGRVDLVSLMARLAERGCNEVWVEAGAGLNGALVEAGLVDEYIIYYAPVLLGSAARGMFDFRLQQMSERIELEVVEQMRLGDDMKIRARPRSVS
jgi:diaminohydroxyphosphoribosylaminopyrimidine deaminase/5-amino-6-(5-phosphoribosylamino)uracil reductase